MAYDGIAKAQHYLPQFLLRNFGIGKKHRVYVLDKQTGLPFATNVRNVGGERRFYDFKFEGHSLTIKPSLSKLEAQAKLPRGRAASA